MKCSLSLIPIVGSGVSLILAGALLVYTCMLGDYGETGVLYLLNVMMEEEGLYFAQHYQEDPTTSTPDSYYFKGSVGTTGPPPRLREVLDTPSCKSIGAMQLSGNWDDDDEEEDGGAPSNDAYVVVHQPLTNGGALYLYDSDAAGSIDTSLSDAIIDTRIGQTQIATLSITLPSLTAVGLLVWFTVAPLRKLTHWSVTLNGLAPSSQWPCFSYHELNVLADTLWNSAARTGDFSQREERFLRYASHELRTPLTVTGVNPKLLDQPGRTPSPHALQCIRRSALGMQQMTETLLWLSRKNSELCDDGHTEAGHLLGELLKEQRALSQHHDLTFHLDTEPHNPPQTHAQVIIDNLLHNILQYGNKDVMKVAVRNHSLLISNPTSAAQGAKEPMAFSYGLDPDLVQRLCRESGWRMYYSSDEQYFRCGLLFPVTPD